MKKFLLLALLMGFLVPLQSQNIVPCLTDEHYHEEKQNNPALAKLYEARRQAIFDAAPFDEAGKEKVQAEVFTIPVVFHVIYDTPYDNIKKSQILDALRILNEDFRRQNADASNLRSLFTAFAADVEVEFAIAKKDENGNCTDGITRMQSPLSVMANPRNNIKSLVQWDPDKYLNIWVVNSITSSSGSTGLVLGYANFPWASAANDGIVMRHDALGTNGTAAYDGRTLTHEVGHYLGLLHTFQGGCSSGDGIGDTPPVAAANFGCNTNTNSCSNDSPDRPDMVENYMDYSDGSCQNTFTNQQKTLMRSVLTNPTYRQTLVSDANLKAVGVRDQPDCLPTAEFCLSKEVICEGDDLQFIDESAGSGNLMYNWTFSGGTPATSTDLNPTVTYAQAGVFDVTLSITNSAGNSTKVMQRAVAVRPNWTPYQAEWKEDFETAAVINTDVTVESTYDATELAITGNASSSGAQSLFLDNYNSSEPLDLDFMISPSIQTLFGKDITLTFDYAYAQITGSELDRLRIYVSTDCGKTWAILRSFVGFTLITTANPVTSAFTPGAGEWKSSSINLSGYEDKGPILLKFEFKGDGGNNFYIDNINITSSNIGLAESGLAEKIGFYPNPASNRVVISFGDELPDDIAIRVSDLNGKSVLQKNAKKGATALVLDGLNLPAGVYLVSFTLDQEIVTKKMVIE